MFSWLYSFRCFPDGLQKNTPLLACCSALLWAYIYAAPHLAAKIIKIIFSLLINDILTLFGDKKCYLSP